MSVSASILLFAQAAVLPAQGGTTQPDRAPLWKNLTVGMTINETIATLKAVPGVRTVQIVPRKNNDPRISITYDESGISIGPVKVAIDPIFEKELLAGVRLRADNCRSAAVEQDKLIFNLLREKYGNVVKETLVDDNDVPVQEGFAFWNEQTRVRLSWREYNPAVVDQSAPGSGAAGALGDIFVAISSNAAERKCPTDSGARLETKVLYFSQQEFLAARKTRDDKAKAAREKTKNDL